MESKLPLEQGGRPVHDREADEHGDDRKRHNENGLESVRNGRHVGDCVERAASSRGGAEETTTEIGILRDLTTVTKREALIINLGKEKKPGEGDAAVQCD